MSMPGVNGYEYNKYYDSRARPRDEYGGRPSRDEYRREPEHVDTRYAYEKELYYDGYRETRPPPDSRDHYDHRDEMYSKVNRSRDANEMEGYRPYKVVTGNSNLLPIEKSIGNYHNDEYPMVMFDLDHLATFTVSPSQGLVSPQDGIKKLRQMDVQTGIWTMRVQMLVEPQDIVIIDRQSGEEMERFPLPLLTEPTAVSNTDRRDVYNNVILFTVQEDSHKRAPAEMHIFQVLGKSAQLVVDEIKAGKAGVMRGGGGRNGHDSRRKPAGRPQVRDHIQKYEQEAERAMLATEAYKPGPQMRHELHKSMQRPDDTDTIVTERTDRDVQLLNHCFDDIERFVGRLQQAADSFKELDRRRRGRGDRRPEKHGYRHGENENNSNSENSLERELDIEELEDGMLTMRSRPPPAKDFIEIFQKFKLSFNLLAKLKPHIHDPNAPELVHFLFTPLSLVVEASKDPRHGTPDLASKVVSPLLSADAKDLLINCLTSKEADLWMSLGDSWSVSRDQWKGYVPPYYPRFADGWQPDPGWLDDTAPHSTMGRGEESSRPRSYNDGYPRENSDDSRNNYHRDQVAAPPSPRGRDYGDNNSDSPYDRQERQQVQELAQHAQRERDERDRKWGDEMNRRDDYRGSRSQDPPQRARESSLPPEQEDFLNELRSKGSKVYQSTHDRTGRNPKELTIEKGEVFEVLDDSRNWWKLRNTKGEEGHAPYTILTPYKGEGCLYVS